jgi:Domain of unknown function (DUF4442)
LSFNERSEAARRRVLSGFPFWTWKWKTLPLAAFAGMRVVSLDEASCTVALPGGWRTQNPFRSTYFAAQAMAAEMSTGAPAMVLLAGAPASVAMLVTGFRASYKMKITGESLYTFPDVAAMRGVIEQAAGADEPRVFVARTTARDRGGDVCSEFEVDWSFKRRAKK